MCNYYVFIMFATGADDCIGFSCDKVECDDT